MHERLRVSGYLLEDEEVVQGLDTAFTDASDVVYLERKKDGSFTARSGVLSREDLKTVSDYVSKKVAGIGREILDGVISLNPYEMGREDACTWCPYKKVCGFESSVPGCEKRKLGALDSSEALEKMREETWQ